MARRELSPACLVVVQAAAAAPAGGGVLVACSGGADSLALTAAVAHLNRRAGRFDGTPQVVVVDHGIQAGSGDVAARVADGVARLGLPARVIRVEVPGHCPDGLEAAARDARYRGLAAAALPGSTVWLGHTLDDQAETVLLGLARGSGIRSLAGMAAQVYIDGVRFVRPLLQVRRRLTARACADWELPVWQDPMNADTRFSRVRVRERVLPMLEAELGPGIAEALARTAQLARGDADELDRQAARWLPAAGRPLPVGVVTGLPAALAGRVLRGWLVGNGVGQPNHRHLQAVWALVTDWHGQAGVDLPGGRRACRMAGQLRVLTAVSG